MVIWESKHHEVVAVNVKRIVDLGFGIRDEEGRVITRRCKIPRYLQVEKVEGVPRREGRWEGKERKGKEREGKGREGGLEA